jgi:FdhD protein
MGEGTVQTEWQEYRKDWKHVRAEVIEEALITIYVNSLELATIMATPSDLDYLALGFLKNEGMIDAYAEVDHVYQSKNRCCVDVWLTHAVEKPERPIITSGCGGGLTFNDPDIDLKPLPDNTHLQPDALFELMKLLHFPGSIYSRSRGVHSAGLSDGVKILAVAEDVGRHNTIDKLQGKCMLEGIQTNGRILLATGRVSSEMLVKSAIMGCPIIASRNSATSMSVAMARAWNITLVGYVRKNTMRVYSHAHRIDPSLPKESLADTSSD